MQEVILVETVDEHGRATGEMEKLRAHRAPGTLHRAFSLFAFDERDRLLLQRRAASKYHSPMLLTNTACGHPFPGEAPEQAVLRRAGEELGGPVTELRELGIVVYHVHDERTGLDEHEYNHVFAGRVRSSELDPDPAEIDELRFVTPQQFAALRESEPFTAWFDDVFRAAAPLLAERGFRAE